MGAIGRFAVTYRFFVIGFWIVVAIACTKAFPSLGSVTNSDNGSFLPSSVPSQQASSLAAPLQSKGGSTATLVITRNGGALTSADQAAIQSIETAIGSVAHVTLVRDQGDSSDGQAHKALITLDVTTSSDLARKVIANIRTVIANQATPSGLHPYVTGQAAINVDNQNASQRSQRLTSLFSILIIIAMLLVVYRSVLAPLINLAAPGLALIISGPILAQASQVGLQVSSVTQTILTVLLLGAGTDYGLFLILRMREEIRNGLTPQDAVVRAMERVGESITFSAGTVIGALLCLVLASFGIYQGLGPGLAIGIAILLLLALTLTPALLALAGTRAFWPLHLATGESSSSGSLTGGWARLAEQIVGRPALTLGIGVVVFGGLALFSLGYSSGGFAGASTGPGGSDSAAGTAALQAHFPAAVANPTPVIFRFSSSVWQRLQIVQEAQTGLYNSSQFATVTGMLNPTGTQIQFAQLEQLYTTLGPPQHLAATPPANSPISANVYRLYRAEAQFISADGRTVQFYTTLTAGDPGGAAALHAVPAIRQQVTAVAVLAGASQSGVLGRAAVSYDVSNTSNSDLERIVPIVLLIIAILLGIVLRSAIAPLYLVVSVALSFFTTLGIAVLIFMHIAGDTGLNFVLPFLMFIFLMALGEDYNILVMSRIREEAQRQPLPQAISTAIEATGTTVTSAGVILAGTFMVAGLAGSSDQIHQLAIAIAIGVLLDTFLVRTLLVPSVVALLGRWNWWPSALSRQG